MAYVTQSDLQARIGLQDMIALFDDTGTGSVDSTLVQPVLDLASARVDSELAPHYPGPYPVPNDPSSGAVPMIVKLAALEWARWYAYGRKSEFFKVFGDSAMKEAERTTANLATGIQYIVGITKTAVPANVGGIATTTGARVTVDAPDGTPKGGDF